MKNKYLDMLPKFPIEDNRLAVKSLNLFIDAIKERVGDVEINLCIHPDDIPTKTDRIEVRCEFFIPSRNYADTLFVAKCEGVEGFPTVFSAHQQNIKLCQNQKDLDDCLDDFVQSKDFIEIFNYMNICKKLK
jgi:hypothetical protein